VLPFKSIAANMKFMAYETWKIITIWNVLEEILEKKTGVSSKCRLCACRRRVAALGSCNLTVLGVRRSVVVQAFLFRILFCLLCLRCLVAGTAVRPNYYTWGTSKNALLQPNTFQLAISTNGSHHVIILNYGKLYSTAATVSSYIYFVQKIRLYYQKSVLLGRHGLKTTFLASAWKKLHAVPWQDRQHLAAVQRHRRTRQTSAASAAASSPLPGHG